MQVVSVLGRASCVRPAHVSMAVLWLMKHLAGFARQGVFQAVGRRCICEQHWRN